MARNNLLEAPIEDVHTMQDQTEAAACISDHIDSQPKMC